MGSNLIQSLTQEKIVAIIRGIQENKGDATAEALAEGGIVFLEVTLNTDGALGMINRFRKTYEGKMRIGAGDGFCAGFLAGLLKQYSFTDAIDLGNLIGSMVVQTEGDFEGLPTWEQVEAIRNHQSHIER